MRSIGDHHRFPAGLRRAWLPILVGLSVISGSAGAAASQHQAPEQKVTLPIGMNYIPMRRAMIAAGYRPYRVISPDMSSLWVNEPIVGKDPLRVKYPELAWCNGTDLNYCSFFLVRSGRKNGLGAGPDLIEISTFGETPGNLIIIQIDAVSIQVAEQEYRTGRNALYDDDGNELSEDQMKEDLVPPEGEAVPKK